MIMVGVAPSMLFAYRCDIDHDHVDCRASGMRGYDWIASSALAGPVPSWTLSAVTRNAGILVGVSPVRDRRRVAVHAELPLCRSFGMPAADVRITTTVALILRQFLDDPGEPRYGFDLMRATGLASGTSRHARRGAGQGLMAMAKTWMALLAGKVIVATVLPGVMGMLL